MRLPVWATELRAHQVEAILLALKEFDDGINIVMLDAPTGTGKTLIAEMVRQELSARALYICSTLALQDQFSRDFPDAKILRGRSNYPTHDHTSSYPAISALDCNKTRMTFDRCKTPCEGCPKLDCTCRSVCLHEELKLMHCRWCHPVIQCPYEIAKFEAFNSPLVCTNLAYFLTEANYIGLLPNDRQLIIIDEADLLEEQLMNFVTLTVSERQQKEYGIFLPEKKTVLESWIEWAQQTHTHLLSIAPRYRTSASESDVRKLRHEREVSTLLAEVKTLCDPDYGLENGNWIYTSYDRNMIEFKPVRVDKIAQSKLWRHGSRFLLMSATMISFASMAENLGLLV